MNKYRFWNQFILQILNSVLSMLFNIVKFIYCTIDQPQLENNFKYLYDKLASMQKNFGL